MTSPRIKKLEDIISAVVAPVLEGAEFAFDKRKRTFRRQVGVCTQIVNFQAGVRSMEGLFAVNLGVYHPIYREDSSKIAPQFPEEPHCLIRERLSVLRDTMITRLFPARFKKSDSFFKWWLATPTDLWWKFSEESGTTVESLSKVLMLLQSRGIAWLEANTQEARLREIHEYIQRRLGKI